MDTSKQEEIITKKKTKNKFRLLSIVNIEIKNKTNLLHHFIDPPSSETN